MSSLPRVFRPPSFFPRTAVLLVSAAGLSGAPQAPARAQLFWLETRLASGMDLRYELIQTLRVEPIAGFGEVKQWLRAVLRTRVSAVEEPGLFQVRTTLESVQIDASTPLGVERYDSTREPAALLGDLVGREVEELVRADGTPVRQIRPPPVEVTGGRAAPSLSGAARRSLEVAAGLARMLLEGGFSPLRIAPWPKDSVALGSVWEDTSTVSAPGAGSGRLGGRYLLAAVEEGEGRRTAVVEGELEVSLAAAANLPLGAVGLGDGPARVRIRLDLERGIVLEWDMRSDLSLQLGGATIAAFSGLELRVIG